MALVRTAANRENEHMITAVGELCGPRGLVGQVDQLGNPLPYTMRPNTYLKRQSANVPVCFDHDRSWPQGRLGYLHRSAAGLFAVVTLDDDSMEDYLSDHAPWFFSDGVRCRKIGTLEYGGGELVDVSFVKKTGNLNTLPVFWSRGDIATGSAGRPRGLPLPLSDVWELAGPAMAPLRYRCPPTFLEIHDADELSLVDTFLSDPPEARRLLHDAEERLAALTPPAALRAQSSTEYEDKVFERPHLDVLLNRV